MEASGVVFFSESGPANPNDGMPCELWAIAAVVAGGVIAIRHLRKGPGHIGADSQTVNPVMREFTSGDVVVDDPVQAIPDLSDDKVA